MLLHSFKKMPSEAIRSRDLFIGIVATCLWKCMIPVEAAEICKAALYVKLISIGVCSRKNIEIASHLSSWFIVVLEM